MTILASIREWLRRESVAFREVHHAPTRTSEESARARGEELRVGGKALLLKVDAEFRLFVLSADRKLDSGAIRDHFGAKKTRFASAEELMQLTGLVPGSVPPFGPPILPFPLYADFSVFENLADCVQCGFADGFDRYGDRGLPADRGPGGVCLRRQCMKTPTRDLVLQFRSSLTYYWPVKQPAFRVPTAWRGGSQDRLW
jgi:Ala-tRNA(Pro) deacylase